MENFDTARQATDGNTIRPIRFSFRVTLAIDKHTEYVILIVFPRQPWFHERASKLRFMRTMFILFSHVMVLLSCWTLGKYTGVIIMIMIMAG